MIAAPSGEGGEGGGRAVAAVPLGHVLLERRSLFVLAGSLYSSHLHGIAPRIHDWVKAPGTGVPGDSDAVAATGASDDGAETKGPDVVANAGLLEPATAARCASEAGYRYQRGTRVSLTFRHANRVLKSKFAMLNGKLQRT